jgi:hypothetical protein
MPVPSLPGRAAGLVAPPSLLLPIAYAAILMSTSVTDAHAQDSLTYRRESVSARHGISAIGARMGFDYLRSEGSTLVTIGVPYGSGFFTTSPGFRYAYLGPSRSLEFGLDASFLLASGGGGSAHDLMGGVDLARVFGPGDGSGTLLAAEIGIKHTNFYDEGVLQPYAGAWFGRRQVVGGDNGAIDVGVGFRHLFERNNGYTPGLNVFHLTFGFELWMPHSSAQRASDELWWGIPPKQKKPKQH